MHTNKFIAHTRNDNETQTLLDHLKGTASIAQKNASAWGGDFAYCCGLAHDLGKYSKAFQDRIRGGKKRVDHSTAGAYELCLDKSKLSMIAAYCIMGHHSGMPNGGSAEQEANMVGQSTLHGRLKRNPEEYRQYKTELSLPKLSLPEISKSWVDGFDAAFFTRMVFSALVDADRLDTEYFCNYGNEPRGGFSTIAKLSEKLSTYTEKFLNKTGKTDTLNMVRNELLKDCLFAANSNPGLFKLTAPTGSGKTISSLAFALKHAALNGLKRIIYIIPYNSIIEQNAAVFEEALGKENVLRHNSDTQYDDEDEESKNKMFSVENWDYPIIVTSSVQFFESLFSNKPSRCRKLFNIAESVLIFDEAQMIPAPFLRPCLHAINTLVSQYGCSAVLATATQSATDRYFKTVNPIEISKNPMETFASLRRTVIEEIEGKLTDESLVGRLLGYGSALCIVNTRLHAQELFKKLKSIEPEGSFHLSTTMYPQHRKRILDEIRDRLKNNLTCRLISTSLVEAGVDLDFETVFREEAGLDSVIQAAGRCNREGKQETSCSITYVFSSAEYKPPRLIEPNISAYRYVARKYKDFSVLDAIQEYFGHLFYIIGDDSLDSKNIISMFNNGAKYMSFPFEDVEKAFKLIDDSSQQVIYFLGSQPELESRLRANERSRELFRLIGPYGINLYQWDVKKLSEIGAIERLDESVILLSQIYYDDETGVSLSPEGGLACFI